MTETQLPTKVSESALSKLILKGDISTLSDTEKVQYYHSICERLGVDPLTKPFDYMVMQGKQVLYLNKSGAEQLNKVHEVSMSVTDTKKMDDIYIVTARAEVPARVTDANGIGALQVLPTRFTDSTGAVNIKGLHGDALANAYMRAETKAKRRATISLLGLAMLDETEVETIPGAKTQEAKVEILGKSESVLDHSETGDFTIATKIASVEPSLEDWGKVDMLLKTNNYPHAYFNVWKERESKHHTQLEVYEAALVKFGKPNKGSVEKDEVEANA